MVSLYVLEHTMYAFRFNFNLDINDVDTCPIIILHN